MAKDEQRYIYFARPFGMIEPIKIGCTNMPNRRVTTLVQNSPFLLELVAYVEGSHQWEKRLHHHFWEYRRHYEWFAWSQDLQDLMDDLIGGKTLEEAVGHYETPPSGRLLGYARPQAIDTYKRPLRRKALEDLQHALDQAP